MSSLATTTTPSLSATSKNVDTGTRKTPSDEAIRVKLPGSGSPLVQNGGKRKTRSSMSSVAKKRKENDEDMAEKIPRRKLLFQPKRIAQLPQDPLTALTPDESPKIPKKKHPCFSQTCVNPKSQAIQRETYSGLSPTVDKSPRRDSLADFRLKRIPKKRVVPTPTLVCTSLRSE